MILRLVRHSAMIAKTSEAEAQILLRLIGILSLAEMTQENLCLKTYQELTIRLFIIELSITLESLRSQLLTTQKSHLNELR